MATGRGVVVGIQTSPNLEGLTATVVRVALEGAEDAGAASELLNLRKMDIQACKACNSGWGTCRTEGACQIPDDFAHVRNILNNSLAIVFGSPVYFGDLSEVAKCFLDRLRRCEVNFRSRSKIRGKPALAIVAAGGSGVGVNPAVRNLQRYFRWLKLHTTETFPVTQKHVARQQEEIYIAGKKLVQAARAPG